MVTGACANVNEDIHVFHDLVTVLFHGKAMTLDHGFDDIF